MSSNNNCMYYIICILKSIMPIRRGKKKRNTLKNVLKLVKRFAVVNKTFFSHFDFNEPLLNVNQL